MHQKVTTIGFDADDTLWQNEVFFRMTEERFTDLLKDYAAQEHLAERLLEAERKNLGQYGFGIKGFVLSMIETAIQVTDGRVPANVIQQLIDAGQEMLRHPIDLLPHARAAVEAASATHRVVLITKGDLLDQERKLAQSGLGELFHGIEIVSDKTPEAYQRIFTRHGEGPQRALMVGNSMKSDVVPPIEAGGWGVFVPHGDTWALEAAEPPTDPELRRRFCVLPHLGALQGLLERIEEG